MRGILLAAFLLLPLFTSAQLQDDFSDGDYTVNPEWNGTSTSFKINTSGQLQLNASGSGTSYLSTPSTLNANTEWSFYIKLSFSPSSSNYARIYLAADSADLTYPALKGYYLQFGETGSKDAIELRYQANNSHTTLIRGKEGEISHSTNTLRIKVVRDSAGLWTLYCDSTGGYNYNKEGTFKNTTNIKATSFGVLTQYTSSNATKFYWDDFIIRASNRDTLPPRLLSAKALNDSVLTLAFSKELLKDSAIIPSHYHLNTGKEIPAIASQPDPHTIVLYFTKHFVPGISYTLVCNNLSDPAGNILSADSQSFIFNPINKTGLILINETYPNPDNSQGLPNAEFIELYNASGGDIDLSGWTFNDPNTITTLPSFILGKDSFLILCPLLVASQYVAYGNVIGLSPWPSLNNSGDTLYLRDSKGKTIHSVAYLPTWFGDKLKQAGGWSLELIDPADPCQEKNNWGASIDTKGGTPGKVNSIKNDNPDQTPPEVSKVIIEDSVHLRILFSESMDTISTSDIKNYLINPPINHPVLAQPQEYGYHEVLTTLTRALERRVIYSVEISNITDCSGNKMQATYHGTTGIPEQADSFDIVINELLFNPRPGSSDFVEVYNRSDKIIDLKDLLISSLNEDNSLKDPVPVSKESALLFPGDYCVITENKEDIEKQYLVKFPAQVVEISSLPSLPDDEGSIALIDQRGRRIDQVKYASSWHYALLNDPEGVSLEKINPLLRTQDKNNWHSAASASGFATPTYRNSQYEENASAASDKFHLDLPVFSPDNDGFQDVLAINYNTGVAGCSAQIDIFDADGRYIRKLANNESLAIEGTLHWDGLTDANEKAPIGIYIIIIRIFNLKGETEVFKLPVTLAGKL